MIISDANMLSVAIYGRFQRTTIVNSSSYDIYSWRILWIDEVDITEVDCQFFLSGLFHTSEIQFDLVHVIRTYKSPRL